MPSAKTLLLGGGSGFIGKHIVQNFLTKKVVDKVIVVSRSPKQAETEFSAWISKHYPDNKRITPDSVKFVNYDALSNTPTKEEAAQVCINVTGASIATHKWSEERKKEIFASRTGPIRKLLNHMAVQQRMQGDDVTFVGISGIGFYPSVPSSNPNTIVYNEDNYTSADPKDPIASLCMAIEDSIFESDEKPTADSAALVHKFAIRPGVVIGADGGLMQQFLFPFLMKAKLNLGSGTQPFPAIHVNDVCNLFAHIVQNVAPTQFRGTATSTPASAETTPAPSRTRNTNIFNAVLPQKTTYADFRESLSSALANKGLPLPFHIPVPIPYAAAKLIFGNEPATLMCEGQFATPKRALDTNFQFEFPTMDATLQDIAKKASIASAVRGLIEAAQK